LTDLEPMLDQEVNRLPAKYRVPLVLCELEGKSRRDAARQLGLPEGTLSSRLARARGMLRKRLTARGLALSAGTLALALTPEATAAPLPQALVTTTVKAAALFGAGQAAGGVLSVKAAALALAAMKALLASKLKVGAAVLLAVGLVCAGFGAGWYGYRTLVGQQAASASVPERVAFADHDPPEELMPPPARVEPGEGGTAEGDPEEMQPNAEPMLAEPDEPPAEVTAPPAVLEFDPFYQKHASARGLPVIGSAKVSDKALQEAAYLVNRVLDTRPDVREAMIEAGVYFIVMHESEKTTDLPEQRDLKPKEKWDRVRGLGDRVRNCGEENLLQLPGDRLRGKVVLIHQIAYAMYAEGLDCLDEEFKPRLKELYKDAMARGLWQGTRAVGNQAEYWSEAVASYFGGNRARVRGGDGYVNTREQLAAYDPEVFQLVDEVFRQARWRYQPPDKRENSKPKP
jgi:alpha-glucosidase